jgi:hypothetical protein
MDRRSPERPGERMWYHPVGRMVLLLASTLIGAAIYDGLGGPGYYGTAVIVAVVAYLLSVRYAPLRRS